MVRSGPPVQVQLCNKRAEETTHGPAENHTGKETLQHSSPSDPNHFRQGGGWQGS